MNISLRKLAEWDGSTMDDRSDRVAALLDMPVKAGHGNGRPLVPPEDGRPEATITDDPSELYGHYPSDPLRPSAGDFLHKLAERAGGVSEMADELNCREDRLRRALDIHGIEPPSDGDGGDDDETDISTVELTSGEQYPVALSGGDVHEDKLLLAALASAGLSLHEIAAYLSEQTQTDVSASEVRAAAREVGLLPSDEADADSILATVEADTEHKAVVQDGTRVEVDDGEPLPYDEDDEVKTV